MSNTFETTDLTPVGKKPQSRGRYWGEWIGILAAALLIALALRTYVFQTFYIPSASMENTLLINDRVLVNKLAYRYGEVHRRDIVVFERPPTLADPSINDLIKRVIALPGDNVDIHDGHVFINNEQINEPYLKEQDVTTPHDLQPGIVPQGEILVLGDNRANSEDGRFFGYISEDLIVGKATVRWWPLDRLAHFTN